MESLMLFINLHYWIFLLWSKYSVYLYIHPVHGRSSYFCSLHPEEILELFLAINNLLIQKMKPMVPLFLQIGQVVLAVFQVYHPQKMLRLMAWRLKSNTAKHACFIVPLDVLIALYAITASSALITIAHGWANASERSGPTEKSFLYWFSDDIGTSNRMSLIHQLLLVSSQYGFT